ncbi:hypothetical protein QJQ45_015072 [Haematococcus lacustris]|nr:hypothetical protein QJQ45_015072 [Haematococcus lacustris]
MLAPPIASPQGPIASPDLRHMYQLALAATATQGQAAPGQGSEPGAAAPAPGFTLRKRTTPSELGLPKTAAKRKRLQSALAMARAGFALALCYLLPSLAFASLDLYASSAPVLAWMTGGESKHIVSYEVSSATLRQASRPENPLGQLAAGISATSSLAVPHAFFEGPSLRATIEQQLQEAGLRVQVLGCEPESKDTITAAQQAIDTAAQLDVLLICSPSSQHISPHALQAEMEQLHALHSMLAEAGKKAVVVYAAQPRHASQRRSLQAAGNATVYSGFGPYTACGPLCQTQVRWLEGMLAILFMALAACAGMTCLNVLDTPSRFEVIKETSSNAQ